VTLDTRRTPVQPHEKSTDLPGDGSKSRNALIAVAVVALAVVVGALHLVGVLPPGG